MIGKTTIKNNSIMLDELNQAEKLIREKEVNISHVTITMYIVFSRVKELFSEEISKIILFDYEKIVNDIITNNSELSNNYSDDEYCNYICMIKNAFYYNNYKIYVESDQYYLVFYDMEEQARFVKISYFNLKNILSIIISKERIFFQAMIDNNKNIMII